MESGDLDDQFDFQAGAERQLGHAERAARVLAARAKNLGEQFAGVKSSKDGKCRRFDRLHPAGVKGIVVNALFHATLQNGRIAQEAFHAGCSNGSGQGRQQFFER